MDKFHELSKLGAGDFEHLDGPLIKHLKGTQQLLEEWGASQILQDAGLYHAAYGTASFDENLVGVNQRGKIAKIIGDDAEEVVYQYCACDRKVFYPRISLSTNPKFKNRFTGKEYFLTKSMLKGLCELTAANEIEIAIDSPEFIEKHGEGLGKLFKSMKPYLSEQAKQSVIDVLGCFDEY